MFSIQKIINIFDLDVSRNALIQAEKAGNIPHSRREVRGSIQARVWATQDLPIIGERYGFLKRFDEPRVLVVFSTKGGVLKTTLALNIARMAALHNIKTCVVGLDIQGDITKALGFAPEADESEDLDTAIEKLPAHLSLADVFQGRASVDEVVLQTSDLPTLSLIPESSSLAALDVGLTPKPRREYWLKENVIMPLKRDFDLVVIDCPPSWSQIICNGLVACDVLLSPLETKINHFRNVLEFESFLAEFNQIMGLNYERVRVPTRFNSHRKLSVEIRNWYLKNIAGCVAGTVRESVTGEEAMSLCVSIPEHAPTSVAASEMRDLLREIWSRIPGVAAAAA